ncbi:hypothetical protein [Acinetobacter junii]|uniref:hypothetical protein n=1 Tax=Acinetobacter junii TaxID=40215 RepID=UPI0030197FB2
MEIRLNNEWVIYSAANEGGVVLGKIPEKAQDGELNTKLISKKYYYSTISGAIQGVMKHAAIGSDAKTFMELEHLIKQLVQDCQDAFTKEQLAIALSNDVQALIQERDALKAKLKAKVA